MVNNNLFFLIKIASKVLFVFIFFFIKISGLAIVLDLKFLAGVFCILIKKNHCCL